MCLARRRVHRLRLLAANRDVRGRRKHWRSTDPERQCPARSADHTASHGYTVWWTALLIAADRITAAAARDSFHHALCDAVPHVYRRYENTSLLNSSTKLLWCYALIYKLNYTVNTCCADAAREVIDVMKHASLQLASACNDTAAFYSLWLSSVLRPRQHNIGHMGDGEFYSLWLCNVVLALRSRHNALCINEIWKLLSAWSSTAVSIGFSNIRILHCLVCSYFVYGTLYRS